MRRISCVLTLIVIGVFWSVAAVGGEDVQAVMDAFLVRESARIERAGNNLEERTDKWVRKYYHDLSEKYTRLVTPLHIAAQDGDVGKVKELLGAGNDINAVWETNETSLSFAVIFNRLDVMECLLENGADPNAGDVPPLWEAAVAKKLPAIRLLLKHGADPNRENSVGSTPIDALFILSWLIPPQRVTEGLQILLDAGGDPNKGVVGNLLERAASAGYTDVERLLLRHGVKGGEAGDEKFDLSELDVAARNGDLDAVKRLVEAGVDINLPYGGIGTPPAYYAAKSGHLDVFKWLLEHGADLRRQSKRPVDDIFLSAAMGGNREVMRICLDHGAPVDYKTRFDMTPLAAVVAWMGSGRDWETAAFLIENGADVNWRDENGTTPLHLLASARLWEFDKIGMEKLIAAGADPETLDNDGLSPLHYAAARGNRRAMAVLLESR